MTGRPVLLAVGLAFGCAAPIPSEPPTPPPARVPAGAPTDELAEPTPLAPIAYYIDGAIMGPTRDAVVAGVNGWRITTAGVRDWVEADDLDAATVAVLEIGPYARLCDDGAYGCIRDIGGLWTAAPGDAMPLFLIAGSYEPQAQNVVEHELGHLLGLTHAPGGIMAAELARDAPPYECPDAAVVGRLEELLGLAALTACAEPDL